MDNNYNKDFEDILQDPELGQEIGPDELAVHAAGLKHPGEVELENILAEDWESVPDHHELPLEDEDVQLYTAPAPEDIRRTGRLPITEEPTQVIPGIPQEDWEDDMPDKMPDQPVYIPLEDDPEEDEYLDDTVAASSRKGRPKRKKGYGLLGIPHMVSTVIWLGITLLIGVWLGRVLWVCCADIMAFGKPQVTAHITVTEEDDIESVSQKLADANLIRYPGLFKQFAEITEKDERIQVGVHELGSHLDYNAMINNMIYVGGEKVEVEITFPEGYNCAQTFRLLEKEGVCTAAELEEWAASGDLGDYWFLEGLERGDKYCLEGYLAPDTYRFYTNDEPQNVLAKFLDAFDARFTDLMKEDLATMQERYTKMLTDGGFSSEYIEKNQLTLHKVLTIASIIERETADDEECYDIASVFYNRLTNPSILTLGSDATVYYAIGDYFRDKSELTDADLKSDSPYNTRKAQGIPPGPIGNPGTYALYAALDPNDTNYHYFIYDSMVSKHLFSETYEEHLQKAEELGESVD